MGGTKAHREASLLAANGKYGSPAPVHLSGSAHAQAFICQRWGAKVIQGAHTFSPHEERGNQGLFRGSKSLLIRSSCAPPATTTVAVLNLLKVAGFKDAPTSYASAADSFRRIWPRPIPSDSWTMGFL